MRHCIYQLVLLLVLVAARPVAAAPPLFRPWPAADTAAPPLDTARVLRQLFAHKRKVYHTMLVPSAVGVLAFNYSLAYSKSETTYQQVARGLNAGWVGFFTYRLGQAVVLQLRYRAGREQALLAALAQGRPLPRPVRRQLLHYVRPVPVRQ